MLQISNCEFCGTGLNKRTPIGEGSDVLFIVSTEVQKDMVERLAISYEKCTFVWRYACTDAEYENAMSGCFILLRMMMNNYKVIIIPVEYVKLFFGSSVGVTAPHEMSDGRMIIPYSNIDSTLYAEYNRVTSKMASI